MRKKRIEKRGEKRRARPSVVLKVGGKFKDTIAL